MMKFKIGRVQDKRINVPNVAFCNSSWGTFGSLHAKTCLRASAQSDQGLHCLLTELLNTTASMNGEQRSG